ncbi:MAG: pyridoxal phosphate-dependent aminotransferase [Bacteroidales bacterium]|nr:pyridoxal phosphate-dependent aminotransferase [Bacteroidales bacterium]
MKIHKSGAKYSAIVGIGENLKKLMQETGEEYLFLNRGVNSVVPVNLTEVVKNIDFNSSAIQVYPPNSGALNLKNAISEEYFHGKADTDLITVSGGSMSALDQIFTMLDVDKIMLPSFYWGAYANVCRIRNKEFDVYYTLEELEERLSELKNTAVVICDPNNPVGNKLSDGEVLDVIRTLSEHGITVIYDSPYRRVFYDGDDEMYIRLMNLKDVLIVESFSKCVGLSGQRVGFVWSNDPEFIQEFNLRILYVHNGVNGFAQQLVYQLLTSPEGKKAVREFKEKTRQDIRKNIEYLREKGILAEEFYQNSEPWGIFAIANKSYDELMEKKIGSVPLDFFTRDEKEKAKNYARICVSVPHEKLREFFSRF